MIVDKKLVLLDTFKFASSKVENVIESDLDVEKLIVVEFVIIDLDVLKDEECLVDEDKELVKDGLLDVDVLRADDCVVDEVKVVIILEVRVVVRGGSFKRTKLQIK